MLSIIWVVAWCSEITWSLRWRHNGRDSVSITSLTSVFSTVYSDADQRKHQSSASLAFVRGIHRGPVNSPHKWPVTRKLFPFDDVIMSSPDWECRQWVISAGVIITCAPVSTDNDWTSCCVRVLVILRHWLHRPLSYLTKSTWFYWSHNRPDVFIWMLSSVIEVSILVDGLHLCMLNLLQFVETKPGYSCPFVLDDQFVHSFGRTYDFWMRRIPLRQAINGLAMVWYCVGAELMLEALFICKVHYIDGLVQERRNSIANALELLLSCTDPSISTYHEAIMLLFPATSDSISCGTTALHGCLTTWTSGS